MAVEEHTRPRSGGRRSLRVFAFGFVLLGICVFAWGLRYKLSLYYPPHSVAHRMPEAKLLTGRDRSAVPLVDSRKPAAPYASVVMTTLALAFFILLGARLWAGACWLLQIAQLRPKPGDSCVLAILNRPPPCIL